jgi:hypothetical protein
MTPKLNVTLAGLERGRNNLLAVKFDCYGMGATAGHVVATCTTAAVFRSYGAALKGARRALEAVRRTGRFPNMCERF